MSEKQIIQNTPEESLRKVFYETGRTLSDESETYGSQWQGQEVYGIKKEGEFLTKAERHTNHHGGHQDITTETSKRGTEGRVNNYKAYVSTMSWAKGYESPLPGTMTVRKFDNEGKEVYTFSTKRRGAGEKLAKITLKHMRKETESDN